MEIASPSESSVKRSNQHGLISKRYVNIIFKTGYELVEVFLLIALNIT
jgi:hypothetical protein